ncbi:MAG TPA: hypothetical protein VF142_12715 [Longimicrobium sp.]
MAAEQGAGERRVADRVFGVVGTMLVLLGLFFWVKSFGEGGSDTGRPPPPVPVLSILSPQPEETLPQPAFVEFDAGSTLVLGPTGWTADGRHLHLFAGDTELMASAADLRHVGGTRYRWTLPRLLPGATTLRLAWSDESHRTIPDGASRTIPVVLR